MFKEMTTKKKIIIAVIVVAVLVTIFLIIRYKRKKKKEKESAYQVTPPAQQTAPQKPKMQIVPEEDKPRETKTPEPAMSVEQVIPEKQPVATTKGAPGTLGVPGNGAANTAGKKPQAASSLPPEFMTNANDPNAG